MDLLHHCRGSLQRISLCTVSLMLVACAATPTGENTVPAMTGATHPAQTDKVSGAATAKPVKAEKKVYLPLTSELVYYILTAEIAGQRGQVGVATDLYSKAAASVDSPVLAGRSAQVATFSQDQKQIERALQRWVEVDPNDAGIYIVRAPFQMISGNFDGVVASVDKALVLAPAKKVAYLKRISANLSELVKPQQGLDILQRLQAYKNKDVEARYAYVRLAAFYKQYDKALPIITDLLQQSPNREEFLVSKADILQRSGNPDQAIKLVADAAQKKGASHQLRYTYGKLLGENGKTAESKVVFEQLYQQNPKNEEVVFALGLLALDDKQAQQAKKYFSQIMKMGDHSKQAAYFMGLSEEMAGNNDAALAWFAAVPSHNQRFEAAQRHYLQIFVDRGDIKQARQHLQQLRLQNPKREVQYYLFEAELLRQEGLNQQAFDLYTEALKKHPINTDLLYSRAMVAESLNRLDVLEQDLRAILAKDPNNSQALNALGYTLADRTNRHQEALALVAKALIIKPDDPFYLDSLGWVYYRLGKLDKAEQYLRKAVALQSDAEFMAHLGEVLWQQNKKTEAKQIWEKGLQKDADNAPILDTMKRLVR